MFRPKMGVADTMHLQKSASLTCLDVHPFYLCMLQESLSQILPTWSQGGSGLGMGQCRRQLWIFGVGSYCPPSMDPRKPHPPLLSPPTRQD